MKTGFTLFVILLLFAASCTTTKQVSRETTPDTAKKAADEIRMERKPYRSSYTLLNDLVHTKLNVKPDWSKKYLYGQATITLHPHFYSTDSLILNARGMEIRELSLLRKNGEHEKLNFSYDSLLLRIKLDKEYKREETYTLFIDYVSKPEEQEEGGSAAITKDRGLFFINPDGSDPEKPRQIWTQGETESNSVWFPTIEGPNQRMTQEIYITVDTIYKTLSNGLLITSIVNGDGTRTDYWKQSLPAAPYLAMIAVGDYAIVKDRWKNIEVNYYVEKEFEKYARMIFGNTPEMIEFFSDKLGVAYPWEKYSQVAVRDFVSGAMENTGAVVHREEVQKNSREFIDQNSEDVIAHELFHHWFGDLVTCESWANMTLNEGFANFGEYLWHEYKSGRDHADYSIQNDLAGYLRSSKVSDPDLIRFDYDDREDMYDAISYNKGGIVLHMLRKYLGDEAFFASLKEYLESHKFSSVEVHDLRLSFEKITGEDLNWFFNQWYLNHGKPSLKIDYAWNDSLKQETITIEQTQDLQKNPLYKIPLLVDVYYNGKVNRKKITIEKIKEEFHFPLSSRPELVNVDAEKMLLCFKKDNKTKENFIFQYYNAPLYLDRYEAVSNAAAGYKVNTAEAKMVEDALNDRFWNIRILALRNISELAGKDSVRIQPKLIAMAQRDPKSQVRSAALKVLAKYYNGANLMSVYENALNDSSYLVMTSAFKIICEKDEKKGLVLSKKLEQEDDVNTLAVVATFYAQNGNAENNPFLISMLTKAKGTERYALISAYSKFLLRIEDSKSVEDGINKLSDLGRRATSRYIRSACVNALEDIVTGLNAKSLKSLAHIDELRTSNASANVIMIEESKREKMKRQRDELRDTIDEIKKNEKDKRLLKTYKGK